MAKNVFFCPKCNGFYVTTGTKNVCADCKVDLEMLDITEAQFRNFNDEEKESFRKECANGYNRAYQPIEKSMWVSVMRAFGWTTLIAFFVFGILTMSAGNALAGIGVIVAGFASISGSMLLADIAEDVRSTRSSIEKAIHRTGNKKRNV